MKTLIIFSHTWFAQSKVNRALLEAAQDADNVTIRNLEELYGHANCLPRTNRPNLRRVTQ